jgi:cysteine sulfinate desulfinase/cysteine desulfurase-like protein
MKRVYLDNASTTPIAPEIIEMMSGMMKTTYANPSSVHSFGRESKIVVENARKTIANILNTSPGSIFFTSGGTEADNMAIQCGINDNDNSNSFLGTVIYEDGGFEAYSEDEENDFENVLDYIPQIIKIMSNIFS